MDKKFRVVLVGCGSMAHTWVEYAKTRDDTSLVAVVDIQLAAATALLERHVLTCQAFTSLTEALNATNANLVFDVTIPEAHEEVVLTALKAGCDVFGEKPLAASLAAAQGMVKTALETGRTFAIMQNRRFNNQIRAYQDLIKVIGDVGFLSANFFIAPHFGGFREAMQSPLLLDMAIHTFDAARFLSGADAVSVYCHEFNPKGSWYAGHANAICIFEMSDGSVFSYNGSWAAEGASTAWEAEWRVVGSRGTAIWDGTNPPFAEIVQNPEQESFIKDYTRVTAIVPTLPEGHHACLEDMFTALLENLAPQTICTDNIKSLAMVFAALESSRLGQKVML